MKKLLYFFGFILLGYIKALISFDCMGTASQKCMIYVSAASILFMLDLVLAILSLFLKHRIASLLFKISITLTIICFILI